MVLFSYWIERYGEKNLILWGYVGVNGLVYLLSIYKVVCLYNKSNVLMFEL